MNVLIGDIGGTKTILAVFSSETGPNKPLVERTYPSTAYASLEAIITEFLAEVKMPAASACFAIAGPIVAGRAQITNLTWVVDKFNLQSTFNWPEVKLLNDLESVAYALAVLQPDDIHTINAGVPVLGGNMAVIAPGTGLGEAFLTYKDGRYYAHASEGSHVSFGPIGPLQMGLLKYMNEQGHPHVSYERVCSGGLGIPNVYAYLKAIGHAEEPVWLAEQLASADDPTPVIVNAALDESHPCKLAFDTLELCVDILGAEAGNLALKVLSSGGIYLGGGISPRILSKLSSPEFMKTLTAKGRFREMLSNYPVHVILNPKAGLLGAAAVGLAAA
jgi:glucokinase